MFFGLFVFRTLKHPIFIALLDAGISFVGFGSALGQVEVALSLDGWAGVMQSIMVSADWFDVWVIDVKFYASEASEWSVRLTFTAGMLPCASLTFVFIFARWEGVTELQAFEAGHLSHIDERLDCDSIANIGAERCLTDDEQAVVCLR